MNDVEYRPFVESCRERGISRTVAYELESAGLLRTFLIGRRRYVYLDSLRELPKKIAERGATAKAA